ncbi:succinate dehydrogenase subunit C [Massarina eburnea CBS 473.64]|uniref:Succinate dehydrogenase subunit C n=1 Tax=Massarina eburnea CBS 473.64 TaxID=1395130 RepID=A0A6A6SK77_9PLEO|nr:succinate dehydrogenase subunit C [Massarina eburnea CBS 473.64]
MSSMRVFQVGLRRAAAPAFRGNAAGRMVQRRFAATNTISQDSAAELLNKQRRLRPVSPHLNIYQPQITWYASGLHRISGVILSGGLYLFGFAYLAAPALGWHMESTSLIAAVGAWPAWAKVSAKFGIAMPFFFHSLNGVRHLVQDFGIGFAKKTVMQTGWTVVGLTVAGSLYYSFIG